MLSHVLYLFAGGLILGAFALLYSMKNKKLKWGIVLTLVCAAVVDLVITFGPKQSELPFRQSVENIVSATIRTGERYDQKTEEYGILQELSPADTIELLHAIQELESDFILFNPYLELGGAFLEIHYLNGEIEQIGQHNNFWITTDGNHCSGGYSFEDRELFDEILSQYY